MITFVIYGTMHNKQKQRIQFVVLETVVLNTLEN